MYDKEKLSDNLLFTSVCIKIHYKMLSKICQIKKGVYACMRAYEMF